MLCREGHLYLIFFSVMRLVITHVAGAASEVGVAIAHTVTQCPDVMYDNRPLKNVQFEGQRNSCLKYVFSFFW